MKQTTAHAPAQAPPFHPPAAAATVANHMRPPLTTAGEYDHLAAAAYLMKHAGTTALMVTDARTGQPAGVITEADITRARAEGKDLNDVRIHAVMTTARHPGADGRRSDPAITVRRDRHGRTQPTGLPGRAADRL